MNYIELHIELQLHVEFIIYNRYKWKISRKLRFRYEI